MCTNENMYKDMFFSSLGKRLASKYCKKFKTAAKIFKFTRFKGSKIGKLAGKQLSDKILAAAIDVAGSKIADKITSLKGEKPQEIEEILFHHNKDKR